eukprot:47339_1
MDQLVKFRLHIDNLSEEEYNSFIQSLDRKFLSTALFDHFFMHLQRTNNPTQIQQINTELSSLMEDEVNSISPKLDEIFECIINRIYQYLDNKSYSHFARCNRSLFIISCNPSQVRHFNLRFYMEIIKRHNLSIDINKFKRVQKIFVGFKELRFLIQHNFQFNYLHELAISNHKTESIIPSLNEAKHVFSLRNITTLYVNSYYQREIQDLLAHIPNLLHLHYESVQPLGFNSAHKQFVPQLKAVALSGIDETEYTDYTYENVYNLCGSELQSFHCEFPLNKFNIQLFCNLQELCFAIPQIGIEHCIQIIKTCRKQLQRIHLTDRGYGHDAFENAKEFFNTLFECKKLESVSISTWSTEYLVKLIQRTMLMHKKEIFKLKIQHYYDEMDANEMQDLFLDLIVFINTLPLTVTKDFMFIFGDWHDRTYKRKLKILHQFLNELNPEIFSVQSNMDDAYVAVSNKGCKIHGYADKWIYSPDYCDCNRVVSDW